MIITSEAPVWYQNYKPGYIGFSWRPGAVFNVGVTHFSRYESLSSITPGHCFVVAGQSECIEALASRGVCSSSLEEYFADPTVLVFFRKPRGWTPDMGNSIVKAARAQIGKPYDFRLLSAHAATNLWIIRRLLTKDRHREFEAWLLTLSDDLQEFICSELAAYALDCQAALCDKGCLADPVSFIRPQRLFQDNDVFETWKDSGPDFSLPGLRDAPPAPGLSPSLSLCRPFSIPPLRALCSMPAFRFQVSSLIPQPA